MNNQSFILSTLVLFMINSVFAQNNTSFKELLLTKYNFKEYIIPLENDSIYFYLHKKKGSEPKNLVLYLQGTSPIPDPDFYNNKILDNKLKNVEEARQNVIKTCGFDPVKKF